MTNEELYETLDVAGAELTEAQIESAKRVLNHQGIENFMEAYVDCREKYLALRFNHIFIGIETDGYAHS